MSIHKVVDALNAAFTADPCAIQALIVNRVPCNQALADDPFVQVDCPPVLRDGLWQVGAIGLINGVLAAIGLPLAATMFSDEKDSDGRSKLIGFTVYKPVQSEVAAIQSPEPQPDQYWQHKTSEDRVYFIGRTPDGEMVWQCEGDPVEVGDLDWSGWEYLPSCDSWDWKSETVPKVPVVEPPVAEKKFPQYFKDCCGMIFRADSQDRIFWLPIDGGEYPQSDTEYFWNTESTLTPLTEFEIGEIVNRSIQAEEMAQSDVMGQSPDDWVPLDEKYDYCQLLPGYQFRMLAFANDWRTVNKRDTLCGELIKDERHDCAGDWEFRCMRKDLPVINARIPVTLYWYDGAIVGRYADSPVTDPSFVPIHSDGNGCWFIERSEDAGN